MKNRIENHSGNNLAYNTEQIDDKEEMHLVEKKKRKKKPKRLVVMRSISLSNPKVGVRSNIYTL